MARMNNAMHDLFRYNAAMMPKNRSSFNRSHSKTTTFDSGYLIPILVDDILPGDEVNIKLDALVRMTTPFHPVLDSAYIDFFAFFCPDRIVWDNAKAFYGENLDAEYNALGEYQRPNFTYSDSDWTPMSLLDYMECPKPASSMQSRPLSVLDFRMYQKIWNDWFRASEIQNSVPLNTGDNVTAAEKNTVFQLRKVNKLHDYFTSLLPQPQGGESVTLPLGDWSPVVTRDVSHNITGGPIKYYGSAYDPALGGFEIGYGTTFVAEQGDEIGNLHTYSEYASSNPPPFQYSPVNLWTDLSNATAATINQLRAAITVQQALEIDAAGGTRYSSLIRSHWGVISPDDVLQRPQLLGSYRESIGMRSVPQTSSSTDTEELGQLGAYSATRVGDKTLVDKAFTEYGTLMILCCVRPLHSYSQGYPERLKKLSRFDIYLPVFNNIGNQPVYSDTIVAFNEEGATDADQVLGYKEAWNEYRTAQNKVTGLMRPDVDGSLGRIWTYADDYSEAPILNSDFISEDPDLIDRTIRIPSEPQFLGDFYFNFIHTRNMGVNSIPGLRRF